MVCLRLCASAVTMSVRLVPAVCRSRGRAADGHWSKVFGHSSVVVCDRGRVCFHWTPWVDEPSHFVDAVTGTGLAHAPVLDPAVDTSSSALLWRHDEGNLVAAGGPGSAGCVLPDALRVDSLDAFRYGVCVIRNANVHCVLRFDSESVSSAEPDRKVQQRKRRKRK